MSQATSVLRGYRRLLRASRTAFRGDNFAISQAQVALRENFEANRQEQDAEKVDEMLKGIDEAEDMLLHHIVQGKQKEDSERFEVKLTDPQREKMRKDEHLTPITPESGEETVVVRSGNVCERP